MIDLSRFPRTNVAFLPTPLCPLPRLSTRLGGPQLWVKRDDQTGLALGGNKVRKLEFLLGEAIAQQADTLITTGAPQSNHARQTAAIAAHAGLKCALVLRGESPEEITGNILLDRLLGADIVWAGQRPPAEVMAEVADALRARGQRPFVIPLGGSNATGALGYVAAMHELIEQRRSLGITFDAIVFATSSGGTQSGMVVGARSAGFTGRIVGVSVDQPADKFKQELASLANAVADRLGLLPSFAVSDFDVRDDYLGGGYAVLGEPEREAIRLAAQSEGLLVDPVYTGRALAGLIDLIRKQEFQPGQNILFWHTGGTPALFAYGQQLIG
ncbi:MAG TPA: D-cysteine desulfhydrase family protein [Anaerolineae bacterium]|nr:D-cysteine desulfhydrase family protein [Anaerolineae bacterium]